MSRLLSLAIASALLLAGCASSNGLVAEGTLRDPASLATGKSLGKAKMSEAAWPGERWWTAFGDPQLDALVDEALAVSPALDAADARTRKAIAQAGLTDRADDYVSAFSRGMRQRLALERVLLHEPRLLLLDEPFTGLDDASGRALIGRLRALKAAGCIVLVATHDLDLAEEVLDRAVMLRDGKLIALAEGPGTLRERYRVLLHG